MQHLAAAARALAPGSPPRTPRTSAARRRSAGRRPSSRRAPSGAPRAASRQPSHRRDWTHSGGRVTESSDVRNGDRTRGRAERLARAGEGVGPRPRGPARHLPQHARSRAASRSAGTSSTARARSPARSTPAAATRPRRSASRPRWARRTSARRCTATWACTSRAASSRGGSSRNYMGRVDGPDARPRRERAHGRRAARADRDGLAPAGDAAGRGRLRARVPHPRGEARRGRAGSARAPPRAATRTRG